MKAATLDDRIGIFFPSPWKSTMFWVLLTSLLPVTAALQWTNSLTQMASCSNRDIYLPANYTLSPGEIVAEIIWFSTAQNGSEAVMAISIGGYIHPMNAFYDRVQGIGQTGITINPLAGLKSINYSIQVMTTIDSQDFVTFLRTITVQMTDPPVSKNGGLNVRQESKAVYDNTTGEWRVQLTCGVLTDLGHPAVSAIWTTPEGHTMESSSQDNGTFSLLLPNPPSGGNYTCTLPPLSPATRCLPPLSPLLEGATVTVDEVKARFTLLEAWKRETEAWKRELRLEAKNKEQDQVLMQLKSELEAEKNENAMLRHRLSSLRRDSLVRDCVEARRYNTRSGPVTIYPDNNTQLQVYCDQHTDGGGWLVFQRRQDGSVDFHRDWRTYRNGFGDVSKNFWLGLDSLHMLTTRQRCKLRVDLMMFNGTKGYATYSNFSISDKSDNYRLSLGAFTGGNAGDSLSEQNKMQFSTLNADHDTWSRGHCAAEYHGAWWYRVCHSSHLNGLYYNDERNSGKSVLWFTFHAHRALKFAEMKLRPLK